MEKKMSDNVEKITKIDSEIKSFSVVDKEKEKAAKIKKEAENIVMMSERVKRPEMLVGATYKIKVPTEDHALYMTINDIVLNEDTEHEVRRPFEIFINSKDMQNFQWVVALTRVISAVFRKGGDMEFLVEELRSVFDPNGGYFDKGTFVPSLIAKIGMNIERHLLEIGMIEKEDLSDAAKAVIAEKRAEYMGRQKEKEKEKESSAVGASVPGGQLCGKCNNHSVIIMDGCATCLSCGDSKCS
jgi:hypothetical protein